MIVLKLAAVVILLLILINKKINVGLSLLIASIVMLFLNGQGVSEFIGAIKYMIGDEMTYTMTFTILFISILGYLMNRYHLLDRMIDNLEHILHSAKATILLAPTIVGLLLVTGGALMSCPVVDKLGEKLSIPNDKRAALNMIFRHGLYFAYPLSTTIILATALGGFSMFDFIKIQIPITVLIFVLGYFVLLRDVKDIKPAKISGKEYVECIKNFFIFSSPITVSILTTVVSGLPFHFTLPVGILVSILVNINDVKKDASYKTTESPFLLILKGINVKTLATIWGILLFKTVIGNLEELNAFVSNMVQGGIPVEIIVLVAAGILAFSMGNFQPALAIVYPLILPLATSYNEKLLFAYLMYAIGFIAYFTSPVHMCQVLTLDYFKTTMKDMYKNYIIFLPALILALGVWYGVLKYMILL